MRTARRRSARTHACRRAVRTTWWARSRSRASCAVSVGNGSMVTSRSSAPSASTMRCWSGNADAGLPPQTTSARTRSAPGSRISSGRMGDGSSPMSVPTPVRLRKPRSHVRIGAIGCAVQVAATAEHAGAGVPLALPREPTAHHVQRLHQMLGDVRVRAHVGAGPGLGHPARRRARTCAPLRRSGRGRRR